MKDNLKRNSLILVDGSIYRVLETDNEKYFCIDCLRLTMPKWIDISPDRDDLCTEEELLKRANRKTCSLELLDPKSQKEAHRRYNIICGIIPFISDDHMRTKAIKAVAEKNNLSKRTVSNYLCTYLAYQNVGALAPQKSHLETSLTQDQKNIRWALNKFYYTRRKNTLMNAYIMMLKTKYTDSLGNLYSEYPSIHQFRYFYRKTRSLQKEYISRDGIKNYEMNSRPLLGDGVQQFAPEIGTGMLDATICDIHLCDDSRSLVGRPVLITCVDAFSSLLCGYALLWEGGMYSIRELLLNCATNKVEWCKKFGILIEQEDWNCQEIPRTLVTDMGAEFTSYNMEQITELGCRVINLPPFRAELKGPVEQIFNLLQELFKPHLKGKGVIDTDFKKRGARDYRKDANLTMDQFEEILLRCIIYYNTKRIIQNFPYSEEMLDHGINPHASDIWNYYKAQKESNLIKVSQKDLILTLLPRTAARFTRWGLKANNFRYKAEGFTEDFLKQERCVVAYDPDDVSHVWLIKDGAYIQFDLIEARFEGKKLEDAQCIKERQKQLTQQHKKENIQARIDLIQHIEAISAQTDYGKDVDIKNVRITKQSHKSKRRHNLTLELTASKDNRREDS